MKNLTQKYLEYSSLSHTFVDELSMGKAVQVFILAVIFVFIWIDSTTSCCFSTVSGYNVTLSPFPKDKRSNSFFYFKYIYKQSMGKAIMNEEQANNSSQTSRTAHETSKLIFFTLTGSRNNQCKYALRKAIYEFLVELTQGHCCSELRLVNKFKAICLLYPEQLKELRGQTVIIR